MPKKSEKQRGPRLVVEVTEAQKAAFDAIGEAMFPGANASMRTVFLRIIRFTAEQYNVPWPESPSETKK